MVAQDEVVITAATESHPPKPDVGTEMSMTAIPDARSSGAVPIATNIEDREITAIADVPPREFSALNDDSSETKETTKSWWNSTRALVFVALGALLPFAKESRRRHLDEQKIGVRR